ncbi:amylo-alpha-1,6-glucosidase [Paenarthrobacter sp. Z7-10]|uniref:glycogen debranching N-terminal domain-containing protein n=1 Tax=Paenarthrobacter sp. Z7-10 TaxID=2787635 RepID=UPI0022A992D7|nr:glycogen debranching N-terminal domain-containing protein [Paenarthrobacter sp. Z7-10]MCZ2404623.1 amylo-alpha-1,6-glucosidase [Paenarthrobacter sp. Z7-10]
MAPPQPYLHDLSAVIAAPIQAWSASDGQIRGSGAQGIYCSDTRVVSEAVVSVNGVEPEWVSTQTSSADTVSYLSFLHTEAAVADPLVSFRRTRTATPAGITERFQIASALDTATGFTVLIRLCADDSAIAEIKQGKHSPGPVAAAACGWQWRDETTELALGTSGNPEINAAGSAVTLAWHVDVPAGGGTEFSWTIAIRDASAPMIAPSTAPLEMHTGAGDPLSQLLRHAISDLNALRLADRTSPQDTFLAAGAPWFLTMFGRDSLIAARMLLPIDTMLAGGTLRALASRQGTVTNSETAEQPGKILHEIRRDAGVISDAGSLSLPPVYFGTIDATLLWIVVLHDAWQAGLPEAEVKALLPNLERALIWLRDFGDSDGDGFLEYLDTSGHGLANQGWKDSGDSIRWRDGRLADGPIALCEVQGYAYAAAQAGATLLEAFGMEDNQTGNTPKQWRRYANAMSERFRASFWCTDQDGPYPAIALDAAKRPVDSVASNMGHLLGTGILNPEETRTVVRRLMDPAMFSGFGIRTVSTKDAAYWPTRYHAGSVWTHDTAVIISGLLADGYTAEALTLAQGLLKAADGFDWRLPELFSGHGVNEVWPPVPYPASCRPQAWAAASAIPIAQAFGQIPVLRTASRVA